MTTLHLRDGCLEWWIEYADGKEHRLVYLGHMPGDTLARSIAAHWMDRHSTGRCRLLCTVEEVKT